jgi:hypothetical protein
VFKGCLKRVVAVGGCLNSLFAIKNREKQLKMGKKLEGF